MHRSCVFEEFNIGIGRDERGHRNRGKEAPGKDVSAGKAVAGHDPGRTGSDDGGADCNKRHELQGAGDIARKRRAQQVGPDVLFRSEGDPDDRQEREQKQQRDRSGGDVPRIFGKPAQAGRTGSNSVWSQGSLGHGAQVVARCGKVEV